MLYQLGGSAARNVRLEQIKLNNCHKMPVIRFKNNLMQEILLHLCL